MKKILLSFCYTGLFALGAMAQPTISLSSIPDFGSTITTRDVDGTGITPGSAGANQTWDFTTYPDTGAPVILTYVNPTATPFSADFPNSNYAFESETIDGATNYGYYNLNASTFELLGNATANADNTTQVISLSNPQTALNFQATLNSSNSDTYSLSFENEVFSISSSGTSTYLADAYGTLITSLGTYTNVLRLKRRNNSLDTISALFGTFYSQTSSTSYEYLRVAPVATFAAWTISYDTSVTDLTGESISLNVRHTTGTFPAVTEQAGSQLNLGIFPNPASDQVLFMLPHDARVSLLDIGGRTVRVQDYSISDGSLPLMKISDISSGTYLVRATAKGYSAFGKLIITH
jgi:hypothetical protein